MHTRHGVLVVPTGVKAHRETRREGPVFIPSKEGVWVHCQIMPPVPQRFEWVHEGNLRDTSVKLKEPTNVEE